MHVALGVTDLREIGVSKGARPKNSPRNPFSEFEGRTVALGPILGRFLTIFQKLAQFFSGIKNGFRNMF